MGVVVGFNYSSWVARYPEFSGVSEPTAQEYFNEATLYCRNDGGGPVNNATQQQIFLNMLTAHIAALNAVQANGQPASPLVGRISAAAQGSVNVQVENEYPPGTAQWYQQTKYGSAYWEASKAYRTMRYLAKPTRVVQGVYPFGRG